MVQWAKPDSAIIKTKILMGDINITDDPRVIYDSIPILKNKYGNNLEQFRGILKRIIDKLTEEEKIQIGRLIVELLMLSLSLSLFYFILLNQKLLN